MVSIVGNDMVGLTFLNSKDVFFCFISTGYFFSLFFTLYMSFDMIWFELIAKNPYYFCFVVCVSGCGVFISRLTASDGFE